MAAIKKTLGEMGNSLLGKPQKAVLIVHKQSGYQPPPGTSGSVAPADIAAMLKAGVVQQWPSMGERSRMEVQYNPASISFNATAKAIRQQGMQTNLGSNLPTQLKRPPSIIMSVDLVFDDVNLKDAFMADKIRLSVGDVVTAVGGVVRNILGEGYSVQPQTNGLIATTMYPFSRRITFQWAEMEFTGDVSEVQARYVMFSVSGKPIRSMVRLNISQCVTDKASRKKWTKAFDNAFGSGDLDTVTGGKSPMDHAGNLLNIRF